MKFDPEPVKKWFGYDRKERRASVILLVIIFFILIVRYFYPDSNLDVKDVTEEMAFISKIEESKDVSFASDQDTAKSVKRSAYGQNTGQVKFNRGRTLSKLELNSCDSAGLEALPGIGPVLSARIIKFRNRLGGYASVGQLREVYGLPPETFELIRERLTVDTSLIKHININTAEYRELSKLPYLESNEVNSILKYRKLNTGKIRSLKELEENKILSPEKTARIRAYITFN